MISYRPGLASDLRDIKGLVLRLLLGQQLGCEGFAEQMARKSAESRSSGTSSAREVKRDLQGEHTFFVISCVTGSIFHYMLQHTLCEAIKRFVALWFRMAAGIYAMKHDAHDVSLGVRAHMLGSSVRRCRDPMVSWIPWASLGRLDLSIHLLMNRVTGPLRS